MAPITALKLRPGILLPLSLGCLLDCSGGTELRSASTASASALVSREAASASSWSQELDVREDGAKQTRVSPLKRVTDLLSQMRSELEEEASQDSEMYDKMVCWCQTTNAEKSKAVEEAEVREEALLADIEERSAKFGKLAANIDSTKKEVVELKEALETAQALREREATGFREEDNSLVQSVANLQNAIAVLKKHQKSKSMLQMTNPIFDPLRVVLHDCALKFEEIVAGRQEREGPRSAMLLSLSAARATVVQGAEQESFRALLEALSPKDAAADEANVLPAKFAAQLVARAAESPKTGGESRNFLQVDVDHPSYTSQSGGIFGVLTQMLDEFKAQLEKNHAEEAQAAENFKGLSASKTAEIEAGEKKLDQAEVMDAGNSKALADAKQDLVNTRKQRSAAVEFLQSLKVTCNDLDSQWEKRRTTRSAEIQAVSQAIVVLTEDDNREHLAKTVSLIQTKLSSTLASSKSAASSARRAAALAALKTSEDASEDDGEDLLAEWKQHRAKLGGSGASSDRRVRLSALELAMRRDSFSKVKEMMDTMIAQLKDEQAEDVKFKAYCDKELDELDTSAQQKTNLHSELEAKAGILESQIKQLTQEVMDAKAQIQSTKVAVQKAGQEREVENAEFQVVVSDQRATQGILKKALQKLEDFYKKGKGKAVLLQRTDHQQTPLVKFGELKSHGGANSVMSLIEQIVQDSQALESEAVSGEREAQADYQKFVQDSNTLMEDLQEGVASKVSLSAKAAADLTSTKTDLQSTTDELASLAQVQADLHAECDFAVQNFDIRQKARSEEIESIQSAKAILSGAQ